LLTGFGLVGCSDVEPDNSAAHQASGHTAVAAPEMITSGICSDYSEIKARLKETDCIKLPPILDNALLSADDPDYDTGLDGKTVATIQVEDDGYVIKDSGYYYLSDEYQEALDAALSDPAVIDLLKPLEGLLINVTAESDDNGYFDPDNTIILMFAMNPGNKTIFPSYGSIRSTLIHEGVHGLIKRWEDKNTELSKLWRKIYDDGAYYDNDERVYEAWNKRKEAAWNRYRDLSDTLYKINELHRKIVEREPGVDTAEQLNEGNIMIGLEVKHSGHGQDNYNELAASLLANIHINPDAVVAEIKAMPSDIRKKYVTFIKMLVRLTRDDPTVPYLRADLLPVWRELKPARN